MESIGKKKEVKHPFINPDNEIKISENTDVHETIDFIMNLFSNKNYDTIIISGLNKAIKKFEGEYLNGKRNGKGKEYYLKYGNIKYQGEYVNGKKEGKGKEYYFGKLIFKGDYLNGERI